MRAASTLVGAALFFTRGAGFWERVSFCTPVSDRARLFGTAEPTSRIHRTKRPEQVRRKVALLKAVRSNSGYPITQSLISRHYWPSPRSGLRLSRLERTPMTTFEIRSATSLRS